MSNTDAGGGRIDDRTIVYVWAVVVLAITTSAGAVILFVTGHTTIDVATLIGFMSPILFALIALAQRETHLTMNSRLNQLILSERAGGLAEGRAEGSVGERLDPHVNSEPPS